MPNRMWQVLKRWKLPLAALFFMLVCFVVFYFSQPGSETDIERAIDRPAKPKLTRPVRKNAVRFEQAKKINKKTDSVAGAAGMKSFRCLVKETFDEAAGILRQEVDNNCDGIVDRCLVQELNAYGELIRVKNYEDCGEVPTSCFEIEYNEYGEAIATYIDSDCDGRPDECRYSEFNDHGDIVEAIVDKWCDGKLDGEGDQHTCFSMSYDEEGMIVSEDIGECGKEPRNCIDYEYDLAAGIRREKWDSEKRGSKCDGTVDFCWIKIYGDDPDDPDLFISMGCDGIWKSCLVTGEDGFTMKGSKSHEVCAKKYDELVKRNLGRR